MMIEAIFLAKHVLFWEVVLNHSSNSSVICTGLSEVKSQLYRQVRQTLPQYFSPYDLAKALEELTQNTGKTRDLHHCPVTLGVLTATISLGHRTEWLLQIFSKLL